MPTKLSPEICYIAGLLSKSSQEERSMVGVRTTIDDVVENFVEVALRIGIDTKKIIIEDIEGTKYVYFFHSKIAKQAREIIEKETKIFKFKNEFSSNYIAGIFDASGRIHNGRVSIGGLSQMDHLMLQNLGIHTRGNSILNISDFFSLIKEKSIVLKNMSM